MPNPASDSVSLLAFGAHPDDIEFGCGGVIARETQSGRSVRLVVCSHGECGTNGTPEQRAKEAEAAASALGASLEFAELGGDAHFESNVPNTVKLAAIMRRTRPTVVLAPSLVENQHPDHAKLGCMVRDAARLARFGGVKELADQEPHSIRSLLYYAVTADAEPRDISPVLVDVSDPPVFSAWTASMEANASKLQTRNYVELQLSRAGLNGSRCGVSHAIQLFPNDSLVVDSLVQLSRTARRF
jgi:LmbE family N-acetylglucosaminyl deacetylase